jgi:hypothetical protein
VNRADTQTGGLIRKHWCWVFSIRGGGGRKRGGKTVLGACACADGTET